MYKILKKVVLKLAIPVDIVLLIILFLPAHFFYFYRKVGSSNLRITTRMLRGIGVFPIINHYYEPKFDTDKLKCSLSKGRGLPGINLNVANQLHLLEEMNYTQELIELDLERSPENIFDFKLRNGSFESGDAEFLYQFIRHFKPKKIIEIGSGHSTKMALKASKKNFLETSIQCEHICIEPYEMAWLEGMHDITVVREKVEDLKISWQDVLTSGDLLFIDSSHIIRPQGDVLFEVLEILPRLKSGVFIHIHDIFTPRDYPAKWVVDEIKFWNEQYMVESLLTHTNKFEIVAMLNYLKNDHYDRLQSICPYLDEGREPGSLYLKVL